VVGDAVLIRAGEGLQGELGMFLHPETSGLGYSLEAGRALLDIAFSELAWHRVVARADADNRSSVRAIEKLGLRREGLFVEGTPRGDTWADTVQYALLAREWAASGA
jgi:RimJ/RimL family protein N-acetyltransferase